MRARSLVPAVLLAVATLAVSAVALGDVAATTPVATVKVAYNAALKSKILVTGTGMTLYVYTADYPDHPMCYDDAAYHCSRAWHPLRTSGKPHAGPGVRASLLGTARRTDGARQVTYRGHPLYTDNGAKWFGLSPDRKPGDINGQDFVSGWWVLSPAGIPIKRTA